ncbi:MAG TPA: CpsD/CapB family tyrosine-protein kinase [Candidatus Saccharimonadales bacterium]|nr:CpsD/CapB family tyrosine-protein kinase [Candidatus Saccharimonadales bacterium]
MSKLFDRTRNALNPTPGGTVVTQADSENWAEELRKTGSAGVEIAETRLAKCRRTRLVLPPDAPTLSNPSVAKSGAMEAYRMLRTRIMRAQATQGLRTLIFSSAVTNEGKTFTTLNLAEAYAGLHDQRVLLIDGDLRTRSLSQCFAQVPGPGLSEALAGEAEFADVVLATDRSNLFFVNTGKNATPAPELFASARWKEFLAWCSECFKAIIIDAPPVFPLSDFDLMSAACDGIVLVVRAQKTQRELLQKVSAQVDAKKLIGIVYNATTTERRKSRYNNPYLAGDPQ